jgi:NADH-quinone oxidoreductase subunit H
MEWMFLLDKTIIAFIAFSITLLIATYSTYAERKVAAFLQDRVGPDRAGPFGIFQPLADAGKFFFKEEIIPATSNKFLFIIGPGIAMTTALMTSVVIPWGGTLEIGDRLVSLQVSDLNIGVLYVFGVVSLGVYGIMIGGWASNNKFSLLGAIRASSQMISYELGMGLALISLIMLTGTLSLSEIAEQQHGFWADGYFSWYFFKQPIGFLIFIVCAFAECNRTPFDLAECEAELVGGYHTEYSSMKLGFYMFAEYINMFISSAFMASLYFGGYNFPFMDDLGLSQNWITIIGVIVFFLKIFAFIFFFMWIRWTIPRFRYDQLMRLGWQVMMPAALLHIFATGAVILFNQH